VLHSETKKGIALTLAYIGVTLSLVAVIGILVGLVWLVVKAFKTWKANQPDAQLEALEEKAEKAKETAEETKKAYEDLIAAQEEYNNLNTNVDDLTEGTTAWKEAVAELNEEILELITLYPQLVAFLEIAENGRMSIK
jgi:predicted nuclease with TOPRIM domain